MTDITYRVEGDYLILDGEGNEGWSEEEMGRYGELKTDHCHHKTFIFNGFYVMI